MSDERRPFQHSPTDAIFVGFAGRIGSGKTSAAKYLSSTYRFQYVRYSQVLQDWLSSGGEDRARLQELGWEVMAGGRQLELNRRLIAALECSRSASIDGLRHPVDFESLSSAFNRPFHLIFIEARHETRLARLRWRFASTEAFQAAESALVESNIDTLKEFADTILVNEASLEDLYRELDVWLSSAMMRVV